MGVPQTQIDWGKRYVDDTYGGDAGKDLVLPAPGSLRHFVKAETSLEESREETSAGWSE
jgi:hypothetical protein